MHERARVIGPSSGRKPDREAAVRRAAVAGVTALAVGCGIVALLHLIGPGADISPLRRTISEYGLTSVAWVFEIAVVAVAAGSAAIFTAVAMARRAKQGNELRGVDRLGLALGALWVLGLVTVAAFPKANWAVGPSLSGYIHRAASLIAFVALPLAVLVLLRRAASRGAGGSGMARTGIALAVAGLAWFLPIVVAIVTGAHGGAWWLAVPLGLIERGMAVTEIAALVALGLAAAAGGGRVVASTGPAS